MWLFVAFLAIPLIEIALFIEIGGALGLGWTLAIVVVTALLGTFLVRNQGALAISQLKSSFDDLRDPTEPLVHGALILFSGALLLTPGFFTDAVGFLLLIPAVRASIYKALRARVEVRNFGTRPGPQDPRHPHGRHPGANTEPRGDIIEGEYSEVSPPHDPKRPRSRWGNH